MNQENPFIPKSVPSAVQVRYLTQEALTDWIVRATLPYPMADSRGKVMELRQREFFHIQAAVNKILIEHADEVDDYIHKHLGAEE